MGRKDANKLYLTLFMLISREKVLCVILLLMQYNVHCTQSELSIK